MALRHVVFLSLLVLATWEAPSADAACCFPFYDPSNGLKCGDCTYATPCCAYKSCNIFCCGCERCRSGNCARKRSVDAMLEGDTEDDGAHVILRNGDQNQDGRLSLGEAYGYLARTKAHVAGIPESLVAMDTNQDGFLTPDEIDPKST